MLRVTSSDWGYKWCWNPACNLGPTACTGPNVGSNACGDGCDIQRSNTGREVRQAVMSGGMPNPGAGEAGRGFCTAGRWPPSAPGVILGHGRSVPVACGGMGAAATFGRDANSSSEPAAGLARDITQAYPGTDTLADQSPATETSTWKWNVTSLVGQGAWVIASVRLSGTG